MEGTYPFKPSDYQLRYWKVCKQYYDLPQCNPTMHNFQAWIYSLKEPMKSDFSTKGFFRCFGVLNYRRFILEQNGIFMEDYLKDHL